MQSLEWFINEIFFPALKGNPVLTILSTIAFLWFIVVLTGWNRGGDTIVFIKKDKEVKKH